MLGLAERAVHVIPRGLMLPAVGQGALGIEARAGDSTTLAWLAPLEHEATHQAVLAERSLLFTLRGGCLAPVGAYGRIEAAMAQRASAPRVNPLRNRPPRWVSMSLRISSPRVRQT